MKKYIEERAVSIANYVVDNNATVRQAAKEFAVSKSTVHKDLSERLPQVNRSLADDVKDVMAHNISLRHIRGGQATKEKYLREHRK